MLMPVKVPSRHPGGLRGVRISRPFMVIGRRPNKVATMSRMAFAALPHENILFPVPYAENEEHPIIITNQRIVQRNAGGRPGRDADQGGAHRRAAGGAAAAAARDHAAGAGVAAHRLRRLRAVQRLGHDGGVAAVAGRGHDDAPAEATPDAIAQAPEGEDPIDWPRTVLLTRIAGIALLAAALGCALGARRLSRRSATTSSAAARGAW